MKAVRRQASEAYENRDVYARLLQYKMDEKTEQEIKAAKSRLKKIDKRLEQLDKIIGKLYEDRVLERITEDRYLDMNGKYETEYAGLKSEKEELLAEINAVTSAEQNAKLFTKLIEEYTDITELNARILNELIDRIVVHEKEIINGEKYQTVEIYYKFVGVI